MWKRIFVTLLLLACSIAVVEAQTGEDCPQIVETALQSVGDLCSLLGRNSACYGSSMVNSTPIVQPPPNDFFAAPGDRSELLQFREINPQPLDELTGTFGAAVLNAQANLPNTLPGQGVIFLLMGDARITNEVAENSDEQMPFQSFYFLPGLPNSKCYEAEPMLTIQTPGNVSVTLNFNGAQTEFSPSTLLTITPTVCTIHRGYITRGEKKTNLLANQTVDIHIEENGTIVVEGARGISEREYQRGLDIQAALNGLATANDWPEQLILNAPDHFDAEPVAAGNDNGITPIPVVAATTQPTCRQQYVTDTFDTLGKIAARFGTTVQAIAAANNITNPNVIYAGETLCIP
jgi:LysM repeat protein